MHMLPPVSLQPGLPQCHFCVSRQHLEGGCFPSTIHPQQPEALWSSGLSSSPYPPSYPPSAQPPALTSPGGTARHSRSTAGARRYRYTLQGLGSP